MKKEFGGNSKKGGVYQIANLTNGKVYIGSAKCFQVRASQHVSALKKQKHQNKHLQTSWNKWGEDAFLFEVLEVIEGDKIARTTREKEYLERFYENWEQCYNFQRNPICKQGPWSSTPEDSRRKISLSKKGKYRGPQNPFYGKTHTKETKKKLSLLAREKTGNKNSNYGNWWTKEMKEQLAQKAKERCKNPEYIKKLSVVHKGKRLTETQKQKISRKAKLMWKNSAIREKICKSLKGKGTIPVYQMDKNNNILFCYNSITQAAKETGINYANIISCLKARQKTAGGFVWRYC